jgi:hypothetical protein
MPKRVVGAAGEAAAAAGGCWEELVRCSSDSDLAQPSPAGGVAQEPERLCGALRKPQQEIPGVGWWSKAQAPV